MHPGAPEYDVGPYCYWRVTLSDLTIRPDLVSGREAAS